MKSFRMQILLSILAVTLCGLILLFSSIYYVAKERIEENYLIAMTASMEERLVRLDTAQKSIYRTTVSLSTNAALLSSIEQYLALEDKAAQDTLKISTLLQAHHVQNDHVEDIYLYLPQTNEIICSQEYKGIIAGNGELWLTGASDAALTPFLTQELYANEMSYSFLYAKPIYNDSGAWVGTVAQTMSERSMFYDYLDASSDMQNLYLVSPEGTVCSARRSSDIGRAVNSIIGKGLSAYQTELGNCTYGQEKFIYMMLKSPATKMTLLVLADRDAIVEPLRQTQWLFVLVLFFDVLLVYAAAHLFSDKLTKPLRKLSSAMTHVGRGDLSVRTDLTNASTEFSALSAHFNRMLEKIEALMAEVIAEQEQVKQAQMRALQYQIKPHFLYNTLNSIKFSAMLEGNATLAQQLQAFIDLLEYSLNRDQDVAYFSSEIKILNDYASLQQYRYMNCFHMEYDVTQDANRCLVPRFLLQPLVENSILHGMDTKRTDNVICVSAYVMDETLHITVADNGVGMSEDTCQKLLGHHEDERRQFNGIGISNTRERLELLYQQDIHFVLESTLGVGTRYALAIPAVYEWEALSIEDV